VEGEYSGTSCWIEWRRSIRAALNEIDSAIPTKDEIDNALSQLDDAIAYDDAFEQGGARDEMKHAYTLLERFALWGYPKIHQEHD